MGFPHDYTKDAKGADAKFQRELLLGNILHTGVPKRILEDAPFLSKKHEHTEHQVECKAGNKSTQAICGSPRADLASVADFFDLTGQQAAEAADTDTIDWQSEAAKSKANIHGPPPEYNVHHWPPDGGLQPRR